MNKSLYYRILTKKYWRNNKKKITISQAREEPFQLNHHWMPELVFDNLRNFITQKYFKLFLFGDWTSGLILSRQHSTAEFMPTHYEVGTWKWLIKGNFNRSKATKLSIRNGTNWHMSKCDIWRRCSIFFCGISPKMHSLSLVMKKHKPTQTEKHRLRIGILSSGSLCLQYHHLGGWSSRFMNSRSALVTYRHTHDQQMFQSKVFVTDIKTLQHVTQDWTLDTVLSRKKSWKDWNQWTSA